MKCGQSCLPLLSPGAMHYKSMLQFSSRFGLGNLAKLYEIFARCFISSCEEPSLIFGSVGSSHSVNDVLEVMPKFVVTVSLLLFCT